MSAVIGALPLTGQTDAKEILRRADAAFEAEDRALAERLYRQVLEIDPYQSRAVYRLGQLARNDEEALRWFRRYIDLEPLDAWGWLAAGDMYLKLGKSLEAKSSFQRAADLEPEDKDIQEHLDRATFFAAPGITPLGGYERDSDGNRAWKAGLTGDAAMRGGLRFGGVIARAEIGDGFSRARIDEGIFKLVGRPRRSARIDFLFGANRLVIPETSSWTTPVADLRLRLRNLEGAPVLDIRAQRLALGTSPLLVLNRAMRNEFRISLEIPASPVRFRVGGRIARIETAVEKANSRFQGDAAIALPFGWRGEGSVQYHLLGFSRLSSAGYFAPRLVETLECGMYWELGGEDRISFAFDVGTGIQCLAKQEEEKGRLKPAFRAWILLSVDVSPQVQWQTEAEGYSAPFAPVGAVTAPNWRYISVRTGLRFQIP
jgi:hypothetical protein